MIEIAFEKYLYFPTLRTRLSEIRGLLELDEKRKEKIAPMLTLGRWPRAEDFSTSAEKAQSAMAGLPYFLDLTSDLSHLGEKQKLLRNPQNGFEAWRDFLSTYPQAIPVAILSSDARLRDQVQQAVLFERNKGKVAFRIQDFSIDTTLAINAISSLDDIKNAIVFIDCQFIRSSLAAYIAATVATINRLRTEFPTLMIVVTSTSFPASVAPFADATQQRGAIDIMERDLHARIGGSAVAAYGDHGAIHSVVYDDRQIMRWSARIDYPRETIWYFERRPGDQTPAGYISAAKSIVATDRDIGTRGIWGEDKIVDAANGTPYGKAPASWIAVRVNIHLARQIDFAYGNIGESSQWDEYGEDEVDFD
jgi:hypothetical protein